MRLDFLPGEPSIFSRSPLWKVSYARALLSSRYVHLPFLLSLQNLCVENYICHFSFALGSPPEFLGSPRSGLTPSQLLSPATSIVHSCHLHGPPVPGPGHSPTALALTSQLRVRSQPTPDYLFALPPSRSFQVSSLSVCLSPKMTL